MKNNRFKTRYEEYFWLEIKTMKFVTFLFISLERLVWDVNPCFDGHLIKKRCFRVIDLFVIRKTVSNSNNEQKKNRLLEKTLVEEILSISENDHWLDKFCRQAFPVAFAIFNIVYWSYSLGG